MKKLSRAALVRAPISRWSIGALMLLAFPVIADTDLSVSMVANPDPVSPGDSLIYTVTVGNEGANLALEVVVEEVVLPSGATFVETSGCDNDPNGVPQCELGVIAPGNSRQFDITFSVEPSAAGTTLTNTVLVRDLTPETIDANPSNNVATATTQVLGDPGSEPPCDDPFPGNDGLGEPTCAPAGATRAEGVLWTAAEQAVSIVSAIADSSGCLAAVGGDVFGGSISLDISVNLGGISFVGHSVLAGYRFSTTETAYDVSIQNGVRRYETADVAAGPVSGQLLSGLDGVFHADGDFAILIGHADFRHGSADLNEDLIKDFYKGIPRPAEFVDAAGNPTECDRASYGTTCFLKAANDANPNDPFEEVRIVRDNGLEVTSKKHWVADLRASPDAANVEIGFPQGKWRQTSFYREPNGPGNGRLVYTKVRIAPFGAPNCALQLDGVVRGTVDNPVFNGAIRLFPLGLPLP